MCVSAGDHLWSRYSVSCSPSPQRGRRMRSGRIDIVVGPWNLDMFGVPSTAGRNFPRSEMCCWQCGGMFVLWCDVVHWSQSYLFYFQVGCVRMSQSLRVARPALVTDTCFHVGLKCFLDVYLGLAQELEELPGPFKGCSLEHNAAKGAANLRSLMRARVEALLSAAEQGRATVDDKNKCEAPLAILTCEEESLTFVHKCQARVHVSLLMLRPNPPAFWREKLWTCSSGGVGPHSRRAWRGHLQNEFQGPYIQSNPISYRPLKIGCTAHMCTKRRTNGQVGIGSIVGLEEDKSPYEYKFINTLVALWALNESRLCHSSDASTRDNAHHQWHCDYWTSRVRTASLIQSSYTAEPCKAIHFHKHKAIREAYDAIYRLDIGWSSAINHKYMYTPNSPWR